MEAFVNQEMNKEGDPNDKKHSEMVQAGEQESIEDTVDTQVEEYDRRQRPVDEISLDNKWSATLRVLPTIDSEGDTSSSNVNSICDAADDTLVLADWNNRCLKRLDKTFSVIDRLQLDDAPGGLCSTSSTQAAVTLRATKTVHIVKLGDSMTVVNSFKTTDCCSCIAYHNDQLFVTCGGWTKKDEGQGHVAVYTMSGSLLRKLETDSQGQMFSSIPLGVAVIAAGTILVCDQNHGLVAMGYDGQRLWTLTCNALGVHSVNRLWVTGDGQVLVSSYMSRKVLLVSNGGRKMAVLLTEEVMMKGPLALHVDTQRTRLVLGMGDVDQIAVFDLA